MNPRVIGQDNLFDYFNVQVEEVLGALKIDLHEDTRLYLVALLAERARMDRDAPTAHTLVELHAQALEAPPGRQARTYRELGDRALYAVGYFHESLENRVVGEQYYVEMGQAAYHRVDMVFKTWFANAFGPVFEELAAGFRQCVQVISSVRDLHRKEDLGALYSDWLETGSEELAARLRAQGLILPKAGLGEV